MIVKPATGEKALWVTERSQLPSGEWRIMVWLNTTDTRLSHHIHERVAELVRHEMLSAGAGRSSAHSKDRIATIRERSK